MLSIHPSRPRPTSTTPHLLPARINHNGRINHAQHFFAPRADDKGVLHAHFRGRHLHGTRIALPATHTGAMLRVTDKSVSRGGDGDEPLEEEGEGEGEGEGKVARQVGSFDGVVVWGHGGVVDCERDGYVRGLEEWVGWAEVMHGDCGEDV
ncbi:ribonuclease H2, subunit C, partial [Ampelomyces quisqualis]